MKNGLVVTSLVVAGILFSACSSSQSNLSYENNLTQKLCDEQFFNKKLKEVKDNDDTIYVGLNSGLIAKNCGNFKTSNEFFDLVEKSYKEDVDLQSVGTKGAKAVASTLINEGAVDYEGSLYERIMLNSYKGINFMNLGDFENARVEFNRALMRQDKAKEYFAAEIEKNRQELEKQQKSQNYEENIGKNTKTIEGKYEHLWEEFDTTKDFINPYTTYLASVFFYMDRDYIKAQNLFREVAIINPNNEEIQQQAEFFENSNKDGNKIFVVYENGFGIARDEFKLSLPFIFDKKAITASVALQTLKPREYSYPFLSINDKQTSDFIVLDNIVATEFKLNMPTMITKALLQTITKTTLNAVVAKNDATGGYLALTSSLFTMVTTSADVRYWNGLPKGVSVVMLDNNGEIEIKAPDGTHLYQATLNKNKSALVIVRSFNPSNPINVNIIQR